MINLSHDKPIYSTARLILRFAGDAESDPILAPHSQGLRSRLCTATLQQFYSDNLEAVKCGAEPDYVVINLVAHWANLGYIEESAIRNHILQSLISHPTLHDHQAYTLIILFKLAGATFEAYVDPSVINRCFELLKNHCFCDLPQGRIAWEETLEGIKLVRAPEQ